MPESIKAKRLSRREFIKAGTMVAGAAALPPALARSAAAQACVISSGATVSAG